MDDAYFEELDSHDIERIEENDNDVIGPDEAEEAVETARIVKPKKIVIKPRLRLDDKRLKGPRGLCVLEAMFKNTVLKGPGYEKRDLDTIMFQLEHWAHRLFPKMTFDDCLEKIEELGHKKSVSSYVTLLRTDSADVPIEMSDEPVVQRELTPEPVIDPFDQLLSSTTSQPQTTSTLTQEQRERMERNQLIAMERRRARLKAKYENAMNTNVVSDSASVVSSSEGPMSVSEVPPEAISIEKDSNNTNVEPILNDLDYEKTIVQDSIEITKENPSD